MSLNLGSFNPQSHFSFMDWITAADFEPTDEPPKIRLSQGDRFVRRLERHFDEIVGNLFGLKPPITEDDSEVLAPSGQFSRAIAIGRRVTFCVVVTVAAIAASHGVGIALEFSGETLKFYSSTDESVLSKTLQGSSSGMLFAGKTILYLTNGLYHRSSEFFTWTAYTAIPNTISTGGTVLDNVNRNVIQPIQSYGTKAYRRSSVYLSQSDLSTKMTSLFKMLRRPSN